MTIQNFRVSKHLKDIIGRELVTDKFVAVFELIKNSIDAGAKTVQIEIDPRNNRILIIDDGCGMTRKDIIDKWLFVAYSAKAEGIETSNTNFRDKIKIAGRKGIGRFSCDTLGSDLCLYSRSKSCSTISLLHIDWSAFENDNLREFSEVDIDIESTNKFPESQRATTPKKSGTVLEIGNLRHSWQPENIMELRTYLAKLIDPFNVSDKIKIITYFRDGDSEVENLNGPIGNDIIELLTLKSSRIHVVFDEGHITTELFDRGTSIFRVSEPNKSQILADCKIDGNLYFLNRAAKILFNKKMGMSNIDYGSIFLFLNGFRIFPIGEPTDDSFKINTRKLDSFQKRLGTRDLIGRIDVTAPTNKFREVSSRDAGLIIDANYIELKDAILEKIFLPLERYVVSVNWKDKTDRDRETFTGFESDSVKMGILKILGGMADNTELKILDFDEKLIEFSNKSNVNYENILLNVKEIVNKEGNSELVKQIDKTVARVRELEKIEKKAQKLAVELEEERIEFKSKISALKNEARFLASNQNLDEEKTVLLLHQNHIYSSHLDASASKGIEISRELLQYLSDDKKKANIDKLTKISSVLTKDAFDEFSHILLQNKRLKSVLKFATLLKSNVSSYDIEGNMISFLTEYFSVLYSDARANPKVIFETDVDEFKRKFFPFDLSVIFENLIDNSRKANAMNIWINAVRINGNKDLEFLIRDDGIGIDTSRVDISRVFNKNYSCDPLGTGLGLYHVRTVLQEMGGNIALNPSTTRSSSDSVILPAEFIITFSKSREGK